MGKIIYGVDLDSTVSPLQVRDAIIECFWLAHCKDTGLEDNPASERSYCRSIIEKIFKDNNWDFANPTKENILGTVNALAEFSKSFRDPSVIQSHFSEIMELVNKLQ
ncbi:MAG TPA: hypothetical protein PKU95_02160 [Candidatus Dojkabacteria bacterium]|jgi:hypothetical protein|nr:hypothetical protein [Candidatus Dojkabacteria bacterium]